MLASVKPLSCGRERVRDSAFINWFVSKQTTDSAVVRDQREGAFQNAGGWRGSVK